MSSSELDSKELDSELPTNQSSGHISHTAPDDASVAPSLEAKEAKPKSAPDDTAQAASSFNPGWRFYFAFSSMSAITLMVALDSTSLGNALPKMAQLLHGTAIQAFWAGTSYLLASTVLQPIVGSFSHIFGRKPLILISIALFAIGIIVASVANNFTVILIGRTIQGIGGGGILTMIEIVVTDLVPLRIRGQYYSFISSMWAVGSVAGPILGGGFAQNATWRWIFWINLPIVGISSALVILFLKLHFKTSSFLSKLRRVDWIGIILFTSSLTGFLIPVTWGGVQYPWSSWRTLVPLLVSSAGLVAFWLWIEFFAAEPLIRPQVLKNRTAAVTYIGIFAHGLMLWMIIYYLPLYYQGVRGYSMILSGICAFPQTFTIAPAAVVVGFLVAYLGKYRWSIWAGWTLATLGTGLMMLLDPTTSTPRWIFINLTAGLGIGMLFPALGYGVQASSSDADMAYAVTLLAFFRNFGQTVGVAVGGTIFQNQVYRKMMQYELLAPLAKQYSQDASGLVQVIKALPEGLLKTQLADSYSGALKYVWLMSCVCSAVALVVSLWTEELPIDRELVTEQGFVHEKKEDGLAV